MKFVVYNLGCKVNQYECDSLVKKLREKGYEVTEHLEFADAYILNTCAVTNEAEKKSRQCVTRCKKLNNNAKIFVCGCASQHNSQQFFEKDGVRYVSGVANKSDIIDQLDSQGIFLSELPTVYEDDFSPTVERTRAYIKIQDGCNNFCSYCIIPYLRGRSRSRAIESIVEECKLISLQAKEIILTGIDISSYGIDIKTNLTQLICALGDIGCRIRLGSLEANVIDSELLEATKGLKNFCPQFHLSLQSGEDEVLRKMNRRYTTQQFEHKVNLIRQYYPQAGITTDLICGFPTESEESFDKTLQFLKRIEFSQIHIFGYSSRKGTVASKLGILEANLVKHRIEKASLIAKQSKHNFLNKFIGKPLQVLVEEENNGKMVGYSKEYIKVIMQEALENTIIDVIGEKIIGDELQAKIL